MATVTVAGTLTLPAGASGAESFAANLQYGASTPKNVAYLGFSDGGSFSFSMDDTEISEPFFLIFEFYGAAEPAIAGPYNYDGSTGGGGP